MWKFLHLHSWSSFKQRPEDGGLNRRTSSVRARHTRWALFLSTAWLVPLANLPVLYCISVCLRSPSVSCFIFLSIFTCSSAKSFVMDLFICSALFLEITSKWVRACNSCVLFVLCMIWNSRKVELQLRIPHVSHQTGRESESLRDECGSFWSFWITWLGF